MIRDVTGLRGLSLLVSVSLATTQVAPAANAAQRALREAGTASSPVGQMLGGHVASKVFPPQWYQAVERARQEHYDALVESGSTQEEPPEPPQASREGSVQKPPEAGAATAEEGIARRLQQVAELPHTTGASLREALWRLEDPMLHAEPPRDRQAIFEAMRKGEALIDPTGVTPIHAPWGMIDLRNLNSLSNYERQMGAFEVARDLEIAHVLGLIRIERVVRGISPVAVQRAFKDRFASVPSVSWFDWALLCWDAQQLEAAGTLTVGATTLTYTAEPGPGESRFMVNGRPAEADEAQMALYEARGISHYGSAHSALPSAQKRAFGWSKLNLTGEQVTQLRGDVRTLAGAGTLTVGATTLTYTAEPGPGESRFTVNGTPVSSEEALHQFLEAHSLSDQFFALSALPRGIRTAFLWRYPRRTERGTTTQLGPVTSEPVEEHPSDAGSTQPEQVTGTSRDHHFFGVGDPGLATGAFEAGMARGFSEAEIRQLSVLRARLKQLRSGMDRLAARLTAGTPADSDEVKTRKGAFSEAAYRISPRTPAVDAVGSSLVDALSRVVSALSLAEAVSDAQGLSQALAHLSDALDRAERLLDERGIEAMADEGLVAGLRAGALRARLEHALAALSTQVSVLEATGRTGDRSQALVHPITNSHRVLTC